MSKFSHQLKKLRQESTLSQQGLAEALGLSKSSINMYERGEREPSFDTISAIADFFAVDTDYLLGKSPYKNKEDWMQAHRSAKEEVRRIPMLGEIACGTPIFTNEEYGCYAEPNAGIRADFCLRAKGDSMVGARIMDGDIVFIRQQSAVENGEIAAVVIDDSATLKRVYYFPDQGMLTLAAENPRYAPLVYAGEELERIHILGKAVAFQSDLN